MITLTAKIQIIPKDDDFVGVQFATYDGFTQTNNLSQFAKYGISNKKYTTQNPFVLGASRLGDGSKLLDEVPYFMGNDIAHSNNSFAGVYYIRMVANEGTKVESFTICFDTINNRHPIAIFIRNENDDNTNEQAWVRYEVDDAIFTITGLDKVGNYIIGIGDWNAPNYPLVITGIYTEVNINIDNRNMISLERTIYDRADTKLPHWGIISNTGNISFNDLDGEVLDYAEQMLLNAGLKCEIYLNNTLVEGASELIAEYETAQWDYDNDNRVVSVSIKDDLEEWQDIYIPKIQLKAEKPFSFFYDYLWSFTDIRGSKNGQYNMLSFDELDDNTKSVLENTYCKYPLLEASTLWQGWEKLCVAVQAHIYKDKGVVQFRYNGGN